MILGRWQSGANLNPPSPTYTLNLYLDTEHFTLNNEDQTEHLLYSEGQKDHI